jgi:hypothetical protein
MICMKKELIASLSDVEAVIVECSVCKTQVRVPVRVNLVQKDTRLVPLSQCPACLSPFDSTVLSHIKAVIQVLDVHHGLEKMSLLLSTEDLEK